MRYLPLLIANVIERLEKLYDERTTHNESAYIGTILNDIVYQS